MSSILWHTINIQIPDKMLNISKTGKVTMKKPLTKTGNIARSNKEPSIIITTNHHIEQPQIINKGDQVNVAEIRTRQNKLKVIKDRLKQLPNKPKISKAEFVAKAKAKVAHRVNEKAKIMKQLTEEPKYIRQKLVTSNKHKLAHSTCGQLQAAKSYIADLKKPYQETKHYSEPTEAEYEKAYRLFRYGMNNRYYVGHNLGSLIDNVSDELLVLGNYAIECWNKVHYKLKDDMYKIFFKRYNAEKKANIAAIDKAREDEKQQVEDWNLKYKTDQEFKKKQDDFKKKMQDMELLFMKPQQQNFNKKLRK